ncbi:acyl-CoA reductase [Catenovulum sediminis]|uniref:acyl-CoA reductase n=1 Tax=Catenovulum sediminis TaxID=1740262 RepID=UPI001180F695|nr:acyl-CoA reductase [Catenovulum sediminis]
MIHSLKFIEQVKWHLKSDVFIQPQTNLAWQDEIVDAVNGLSAFILKQPSLKAYPEIIALAFWFRGAHLKQLQQQGLQASDKNGNGKIAGKVFHIAPANVDTVFLYSALLSVLCGNQNIVRVSGRSGEVTHILIEIIKLYAESELGKTLARYLSIVEYSAQLNNVTAQLSRWCDLRVVWGGDTTIELISAIEPDTKQLSFPDRYSIALLTLPESNSIEATAQNFLTDILPFNQQACSSPKAIYWLNVDENKQQDFWQSVQQLLPKNKNQLTMSNKVEQHILLQKLAVSHGIELAQHSGKSFAKIQSVGPLGHCKVKNLTAEMLIEHSGNGLVLEMQIETPQQIENNDKLQSLLLDVEVKDVEVKECALNLGKRQAQLGKALEFDVYWDGINLIESFTLN